MSTSRAQTSSQQTAAAKATGGVEPGLSAWNWNVPAGFGAGTLLNDPMFQEFSRLSQVCGMVSLTTPTFPRGVLTPVTAGPNLLLHS